ncbi:MAG: hypothetical protein ACRERD_06480 [Candidatus Binatia bacterium]
MVARRTSIHLPASQGEIGDQEERRQREGQRDDDQPEIPGTDKRQTVDDEAENGNAREQEGDPIPESGRPLEGNRRGDLEAGEEEGQRADGPDGDQARRERDEGGDPHRQPISGVDGAQRQQDRYDHETPQRGLHHGAGFAIEQGYLHCGSVPMAMESGYSSTIDYGTAACTDDKSTTASEST